MDHPRRLAALVDDLAVIHQSLDQWREALAVQGLPYEVRHYVLEQIDVASLALGRARQVAARVGSDNGRNA
ncbi:hypothetical protein [Azospirillum canadense]|uniref:hypothetical protein n=1 Tax=Azospirillum canadense TaxID=403962 RepID=UPI00222691F4|nr:hypothetical protein [Azospirillum canadense]MCW2239098.1 hypothetical protein [Azospirillum canadense]